MMQVLPNSWTLSSKGNGNNNTSPHTATTGTTQYTASSNTLLCTTRDYLSSEQDSARLPPSLHSSHHSPDRCITAGLPATFNTPPHTATGPHGRPHSSSPITDRANLDVNGEVEVEGVEGMHSPLPRNSNREGREWDRFKATSVSVLAHSKNLQAQPSNASLLPQCSSMKLAPPGETVNHKQIYRLTDRYNDENYRLAVLSQLSMENAIDSTSKFSLHMGLPILENFFLRGLSFVTDLLHASILIGDLHGIRSAVSGVVR